MQPLRNDAFENRQLDPLPPRNDEHTNVIEGSLWMLAISVILFFIPAVNGFLGGLVGGYRVGTVGRAVLAAIVPGLIASGILWYLLSQLHWPVLGFFAGVASATLIVFSNLGLLLGAVVGAVLSSRR